MRRMKPCAGFGPTRWWTSPAGGVRFEGCRLNPKPVQKSHVPIVVSGYAEPALRRAARFGAGWHGFNRDPAATREMIGHLDGALAKAGRARSKDFEIIVTLPMAMPIMKLGSQQPERVDRRLAELDRLMKANA